MFLQITACRGAAGVCVRAPAVELSMSSGPGETLMTEERETEREREKERKGGGGVVLFCLGLAWLGLDACGGIPLVGTDLVLSRSRLGRVLWVPLGVDDGGWTSGFADDVCM